MRLLSIWFKRVCVVAAFFAFASSAWGADPQGATRVGGGLQALYGFSETEGPIVRDSAGVDEPFDLKIADPSAVERGPGTLTIKRATIVESERAARRLIETIRRSGALTIEAWVETADSKQSGPARLVTISDGPSQRNATLGQDGDEFDVRLRTQGTNNNGLPSLGTKGGVVSRRLAHVVYTRDRAGRTRIYVDGKVRAEGNARGALSNWDRDYRFALANEIGGGRPWLGTYHLIAIYNRNLVAREVQRNFRAGPNAEIGPDTQLAAGPDPNRILFETEVAPLLVQHCFECHDAATNEGELSLAHKKTALAGGASGKSILPGKPEESLLWQMVEAGDMPLDRPSLSKEEKEVIRRWIAGGATWSLEQVDPALYAHEQSVPQLWVQRLTVPEYIATVERAVGVDIAEEARELLPRDLRADGFSNTAYNLNVDLGHVEAYARLAEIIVSKMDVEAYARQYTKSKRLIDNNMRPLVADMGKWILRGPLEEHEVAVYRGISTTVASAGGDFEEAVGLILQAMLQSPRFLYRIENQRGDGSLWALNDYELASRLSYIVWGAPPDRELMRAADAGELTTGELRPQVARMLQDRRAVTRSKQFVTEWLNLDRLQNMRPGAARFPGWEHQLALDMRDETLAFFEEVVWNQDRPLTDLFNAQVTLASAQLARHYGLDANEGKSQDGLLRFDLSKVPSRGGLLTQGSVLTVGGDEASMVTRGLFVLHNLLRGVVKDPPPCVDTTPVPTKAGLTQRSIAEARIANTACGGCHSKFEPLAFGLEKFDGVGAYHEKDEHGNPLREDGEILFPGSAETVAYQTSAELMDLLAGSDRVRESISWKVAQFALGRPLTVADAGTMQEIHAAAVKEGFTYRGVITAIVLSDLVRATRTEPL